MENYLVVRAEEEQRRTRTIWTTDNLKSVLELWIQSLPYMTEEWIPDFIYCSVRARAWLLHDGQQRGHQQLQGHPPGDGQVASLMILVMTTVTLMMIVALKMFAALTDDHDDNNCHSDDDCRSDWWSLWWLLPFWWLWWRSLTRRSIVVNTKPLKVEEGVHGDLAQGHSGWDALANICRTHLSGDYHCSCYFDFDL